MAESEAERQSDSNLTRETIGAQCDTSFPYVLTEQVTFLDKNTTIDSDGGIHNVHNVHMEHTTSNDNDSVTDIDEDEQVGPEQTSSEEVESEETGSDISDVSSEEEDTSEFTDQVVLSDEVAQILNRLVTNTASNLMHRVVEGKPSSYKCNKVLDSSSCPLF